MASFISYGGNIYMMAGLSSPADFNRYQRDMEYSIGTFAELRDQSKLNRKPEQIKIVSNTKSQSLQQALLASGITQARLNEFAVLNGMELKETVPAGTLFKSISGGN
jgi:predicted Zn-dependent protease